MRKFAIVLASVFLAFSAFADSTPTSKTYVDAQVGTLQDSVPAVDNNTVLTRTNTAGEIGEKAIYDTSQTYAEQTDSLVTAEDANAAIQNAINAELVCRDYDAETGGCLIYDIVAVNPTGLPSGYTALEYLESTGTQYLNLGQPIGSGENITTKFAYTADVKGIWFGARAGDSYSAGFVFEFAQYADSLFILSQNTTVTSYRGYQVNGLSFMTPYTLHWYGNPFQDATLSPNQTFHKRNIDESNYLVTPAYNAFLFAFNRANLAASSHRPMRIYYFTVEGKMNLVPARRNSDGELGMYDTISNTFFTNAGTGKFLAPNYLPTEN